MAETRGRPRDSDDLRAAKMRCKAAKTDEARVAAQADVDAISARERAAKAGERERRVYTEEEKLQLLIEREPKIREAEERLKEERQLLASAFGGMAIARKRLDLFRRALTEEGEAEARELIEMRERVAARRHGDASASAAAA